MTASVAAITEDVRTDLATGYEPVFTDRPAQLRHPLVPAVFTVSSTADGSIVSNVIDMAAHARLLLNRGAGPDGPVLSEAMFDVLTTKFVDQPDDPGTAYGYGLDVGEDERGPWIGHSGGMVGYTAFTAVEPESGLGDRRPAERVGVEGRPGDLRARRRARLRHRSSAPRCVGPARADHDPGRAGVHGRVRRPGGWGRARGSGGRRRAAGHDRRRVRASGARPVDAHAGEPVPGGAPGTGAVPDPVRSRAGRRALRRRSTATAGSAANGTRAIRRARRRRSGSRIRASTATTIPGCRPSAWCCARGGWLCSSRSS